MNMENRLKTAEVHTLSVGDKFILDSYSEKYNSVYLVYEKNAHGSADCVEMHSGKTFTFGRDFVVHPVKVILNVRRVLNEKPVDLTNKCGSCEYASDKCKELYKNMQSYVKCTNPARHFEHEISAYRPRSSKCCKEYKAKETENA